MMNPEVDDFIWSECQVLKVLPFTTNDGHPTVWRNRFMGFVAGAISMALFIFTLDWLLP